MVLACRDEEKGADAVQRIKRIHPNSLVQCMQVNIEEFIFCTSSTCKTASLLRQYIIKHIIHVSHLYSWMFICKPNNS